MNKVFSILGEPGAGKTTISKLIKENSEDTIYFEFGNFYRAITYFLFYELKLDERQIETFVNNEKLLNRIPIGYKYNNNEIEFGINKTYYDEEQLFNKDMNLKTVIVGGLLGDKYNEVLRKIIDNTKEKYNVIINSRRPKETYPDLDKIIFLKADFNTRVDRKSKQNNTDIKETRRALFYRDKKEKENAFSPDYEETVKIDTNNKSIEEVFVETMRELGLPIKKRHLTLILNSYRCNKNCPFCIAKMNLKFNEKDNIENIGEILENLQKYKMEFEKFVISGNGEPSLYSYEDLENIVLQLEKHKDLFKNVRIHTSGNIFLEDKKFDLINNSDLNTYFSISRISMNNDEDKDILRYKENYFETSNFKKANNINLDLFLTKYIMEEKIEEKIINFIEKNPNIKTVRFKRVLYDEEAVNEKYVDWIKSIELSEEIKDFRNRFEKYNKDGNIRIGDTIIEFSSNGNYTQDYAINGGKLKDYTEKEVRLGDKEMVEKPKIVYEMER